MAVDNKKIAEVRIGSLSVVRGAFFMSIHPGITCNEISCQQASRAAQARAESCVLALWNPTGL